MVHGLVMDWTHGLKKTNKLKKKDKKVFSENALNIDSFCSSTNSVMVRFDPKVVYIITRTCSGFT